MSGFHPVAAGLGEGDWPRLFFGLIFMTALEAFIGLGTIAYAVTRESLETAWRVVLIVFGVLLVTHAVVMWLL